MVYVNRNFDNLLLTSLGLGGMIGGIAHVCSFQAVILLEILQYEESSSRLNSIPVVSPSEDDIANSARVSRILLEWIQTVLPVALLIQSLIRDHCCTLLGCNQRLISRLDPPARRKVGIVCCRINLYIQHDQSRQDVIKHAGETVPHRPAKLIQELHLCHPKHVIAMLICISTVVICICIDLDVCEFCLWHTRWA